MVADCGCMVPFSREPSASETVVAKIGKRQPNSVTEYGNLFEELYPRTRSGGPAGWIQFLNMPFARLGHGMMQLPRFHLKKKRKKEEKEKLEELTDDFFRPCEDSSRTSARLP